ncbi:Phenylacetaldehyde dehydrogenase [Sphingobium chlorophenolicum L-1]|uniref:Phenylacetaldehyde dehydrogenase n=1 Tax=Sphingobium chlorophenolicum L-1 TaxID=690566 RepID=F6EWX4_SPHCR|nr:aldehyde dehydrogenase family protein [Sphingobium chlorophenolicum]AEG48137.1 Phenylacetaldehyde dehydrogenase [Sphingobium chlorophenolicum L-1]
MTYTGPFTLDPTAAAFLGRAPALFIDGRSVAADGRGCLPVYDPSSGTIIAEVADASAPDVDRAVCSAHAAFVDGRWRNLRPADRERVLLRLADLLEVRAEAFAQLESLEQGKSINIARMIEVGASIDWIRYAAGLATKISGRTFDLSLPGGPTHWTAYTRREPVGVVAAIAPWNFPLMIALWKVLPALASGCSIVLKPSEVTPLTALLLAEMALEAGVPAGVFNVVTGSGAVAGRALAEHPLVAKISFTGSTATGKAIGHAAIDGMKRFTLELGGKNPALILRDAKLEKVVPGLMAGGFLNGGQVCAAVSRIYVEAPLYDDLVAALSGAIAAVTVGPGLDPEAQLNPLVSATHSAKVKSYLDDADAAGAKIVRGAAVPEEGYYVSPALILNAPAEAKLVREEVFGPVLNISRVADAEEGLRLANDNDLGLAASLWTQDIDQAMALTRRIEAGTIWVNSHVFIDPNMPFGGFKQSGLGRDFGMDWLDGYTEEKSICIAH